jgi:hypothetical protein
MGLSAQEFANEAKELASRYSSHVELVGRILEHLSKLREWRDTDHLANQLVQWQREQGLRKARRMTNREGMRFK